MRKTNHNQQVHRNQHQISSFSLSCCLRPPHPKLADEASAGCMRHFRRTPKLTKSSLTSSASSSSQLLKSDWGSVGRGPTSPKVGCMGHVRRSDGKRLSKGAKVEDCCGGRKGVGVADTMDPPLPVPKRRVFDRDAKVADSLWRRRRGGDLESLDVGQVKMRAQLNLQLGFGCSRDIEA